MKEKNEDPYITIREKITRKHPNMENMIVAQRASKRSHISKALIMWYLGGT